jgi:protein O-GlcNAc transferase
MTPETAMNAPAQPLIAAALVEPVGLMTAGRPAEAAALFQALAAAAPGEPEPWYWLHSALAAAGDAQGANAALIEARTLHGIAQLRALGVDIARLQRKDTAYAKSIGDQLCANKLMAAASVVLAMGLDFNQTEPLMLLAYGLSLQHQGRVDEAVNVFSAAGELFPNASIHQFLLYPLFHVADRGRRVSQAARHWAALYADPLTPPAPAFANARTSDRRLKIGYIGPNFAHCQVTQFLMPVFEAHDPAAVELYLYGAEAETEEGLPATAQRRSIGAMSDETVADLVRADRIDILIDVWGHTAGSRLCVFARRPAPVQIAWINFVQTTGLAAIDYVMHADSLDAPGTKDMFVEQVWRMGEIMAPFRPLPGRPPVAPTPALRNGFVTFGSFNNPVKLSDATVAAWGAILRARPSDRLVLKYSYFTDPALQRAVQARFAAYGVDAARIEFRGDSRGEAYLAEFQDIDLALDPSPCPGGTTSCDALSSGVPMLTLRGEDFYARIGLPTLLPCGLAELVADSWDDYVARALALTADARALDALRQRVRPAFEASAYRDEVGFTRRLEAQFRQMFQIWLDKTAAERPLGRDA